MTLRACAVTSVPMPSPPTTAIRATLTSTPHNAYVEPWPGYPPIPIIGTAVPAIERPIRTGWLSRLSRQRICELPPGRGERPRGCVDEKSRRDTHRSPGDGLRHPKTGPFGTCGWDNASETDL